MKKVAKNLRKRLLNVLVVMVLVFSTAITAHAAGVETLNTGVTEMGDFVFYDTNTTPTKTVNGTDLTIFFNWRRADGLYGAPNADAGLGDVKLTVQILDATTNTPLTSKQVFYYDGTAVDGYVTDYIHLSVPYGQQIKVWMDASSVNPSQSNGNYRSIYLRSFWAEVF